MRLPGDRDFYSRPVDAGYVKLHQLYDGTYDLAMIAELNEIMDAKAENEWRARQKK